MSAHIPPCSSTDRFDCCLFLYNTNTNVTTITVHTIRTTNMTGTTIAVLVSGNNKPQVILANWH